MGTATPINLYDAGLFSALAYAPNNLADSEAWGLTSGGTLAQDAQALQGMDWYDITGQLAQSLSLKGSYFFDQKTQAAFHVFENSFTKQIVFVFRGSTSPSDTVYCTDLLKDSRAGSR
jgi:hypothetical protein